MVSSDSRCATRPGCRPAPTERGELILLLGEGVLVLPFAELQRAFWSVADDELEPKAPNPGVDGATRHAAVRVAARGDLALPFAEVENHGGAVATNRDLAELVARIAGRELRRVGRVGRQRDEPALFGELRVERLCHLRNPRIRFRATVEQ